LRIGAGGSPGIGAPVPPPLGVGADFTRGHAMPGRSRADGVESVLEGVRARRSNRRDAESAAAEAAFRATVEQRLQSLEGGLGELKGRVNGLLFLVAGTVLIQVLQRLVHW